MNKSLFLGAAAVAAMAFVATSCGEKSGKETASSAGAKKAQDNTVRIEGAFRGEEEARFQEIVKIFNAKHPDFNVTL